MPSASSASALPDDAEIERLPCFATGTPRGGGEDRVGRADVERLQAAARAAHVGEVPVDLGIDQGAVRAHRADDRRQLVRARALGEERDEEAGDLHLADDAVPHVLDELGHLGIGEVLAPRQLPQ